MGWGLVLHARIFCETISMTIMILLLDYLPNFIRRWILSKEYTGVDLENRLELKIFGGTAMIRELHRMNKVNMAPCLRVGDWVSPPFPASPLKMHVLSSDTTSLLSNMQTSRPMVLNFGSCT